MLDRSRTVRIMALYQYLVDGNYPETNLPNTLGETVWLDLTTVTAKESRGFVGSLAQKSSLPIDRFH